ncbi:MAG: hypothetical protein ACLT98_04820 [Eggerthellaceae bacterium]
MATASWAGTRLSLTNRAAPLLIRHTMVCFLYDESKWNNEQNELPATTTSATVYKHGLKLSADATYVIPDSVDLTQKHCYIARFEHRVDYYVMDPNPIKDTEWSSLICSHPFGAVPGQV